MILYVEETSADTCLRSHVATGTSSVHRFLNQLRASGPYGH